MKRTLSVTASLLAMVALAASAQAPTARPAAQAMTLTVSGFADGAYGETSV
jgi:hypothetical protein